MPSTALILTALSCEALPLIKAWQAKPLRQHPCAERFQVFHADGVYIATTGIGKVRAAIATATLLTGLFPRMLLGEPMPFIANIGIAGSSNPDLPIGTLTYINKVRDVATNTRFYPDILVRHHLHETALDTYDHPVNSPPPQHVTIDMEACGIIQATTTLSAPSQVCILKVISDHCTGIHITPQDVTNLITPHTETIRELLDTLRSTVEEPAWLHEEQREILKTSIEHGSLSVSQQIELERRVRALHAQGIDWTVALYEFLNSPITSKEIRNTSYNRLLQKLVGAISL